MSLCWTSSENDSGSGATVTGVGGPRNRDRKVANIADPPLDG